MGLGGHLGGRLGGHDKTKCVTRVDIRVDTFYMFSTTFTPLIKTKKSGLTLFLIIYTPHLFRIRRGIISSIVSRDITEPLCF